jgi:para-nitrobenzyl esterase
MKAHMSPAVVAAVLGLAIAPGCYAQQPAVGAEPGAAQLALANIPARETAKLKVSSPAFANGGDIPFENTQYKGNIFPGLSWSKGPHGTRSYAIIMQDDDALFSGAIILHWTLYDIPPDVSALQAGMTAPPAGASYGPNIMGPNHAYMGPHTPPGPKHHYHIQVFALDETITPHPITSYADLTGAMTGHVLASGELVGLAHAPPAN